MAFVAPGVELPSDIKADYIVEMPKPEKRGRVIIDGNGLVSLECYWYNYDNEYIFGCIPLYKSSEKLVINRLGAFSVKSIFIYGKYTSAFEKNLKFLVPPDGASLTYSESRDTLLISVNPGYETSEQFILNDITSKNDKDGMRMSYVLVTCDEEESGPYIRMGIDKVESPSSLVTNVAKSGYSIIIHETIEGWDNYICMENLPAFRYKLDSNDSLLLRPGDYSGVKLYGGMRYYPYLVVEKQEGEETKSYRGEGSEWILLQPNMRKESIGTDKEQVTLTVSDKSEATIRYDLTSSKSVIADGEYTGPIELDRGERLVYWCETGEKEEEGYEVSPKVVYIYDGTQVSVESVIEEDGDME